MQELKKKEAGITETGNSEQKAINSKVTVIMLSKSQRKQ